MLGFPCCVNYFVFNIGLVHDKDLGNEVEDEIMAFEELVHKKHSRKKGRHGKL